MQHDPTPVAGQGLTCMDWVERAKKAEAKLGEYAEEIVELTSEVARLRRLLAPAADRVERAAEALYYRQSLAKDGRDPEWADVDDETRREFTDAAYTVLEAGR